MAQHGHLIGAAMPGRPKEPRPARLRRVQPPPQQGDNRGGNGGRGHRGGNQRPHPNSRYQAPEPQAQGGPQVWGQRRSRSSSGPE